MFKFKNQNNVSDVFAVFIVNFEQVNVSWLFMYHNGELYYVN